jgi:NADPH:quinone reductase-like Zn-dependent oxidoreductase
MHLIDGQVLVEGTAPQPQPGPGELLIAVRAAGVTTAELQWYPTLHTKAGGKRLMPVPGHEFSGIIAGIGSGVGGFELAEEVYGMNDWFADGALAEYCLAPSSGIAAKPQNLTHTEAASVPIGGLTAWQGLFDHAELRSGDRVLVHGGAGAVGIFAVQLARLHGAHVVSTASARNFDLVAGLGAEELIDYTKTRFEEKVRDIDVVFDTTGGDTLERSRGVLKPGGRLVTVASAALTGAEFFIVEPNRNQLKELTNLLETGRLRTVVDTVIPLAEAPDAYTGRVKRSSCGKLVVEVT